MRGGKIVLLVSGLLLVLIGLGLAAAGIASGAVHLFQRDADGFVTTPAVDLTSDGYALTAEHVELVVTPGEWAPWMERVDLRLRVTPATDDGAIFVGIADRADAEGYLAGVARDEIADLGTPGPRYRTRPGDAVPGAPGEQTFWAASAEGTGTQTLTWTAESGRWWVVVMNADASPGVAVQADAGAQTGVLGPIALGLLIAALALLAGGTAMIVAAVPGAERAPAPIPERPIPALPRARTHPVALVGHLDPQVSRWQWLVKWLLLLPHVVVLVFLWAAFVVLTVVAWFAILVTGRYPRAIFEFNVGVLRWTWRVTFYGYSALGTDRYPPFTLADADYPARLDIAYPQRLSRGLVLVKSWLLALPHLLIVAVLTGGGVGWTFQLSAQESWQVSFGGGLIGLLVLVAGLALLFTARYPGGLFDLLIGLNRWVYRVIAYVALMTDDYPPFRLDLGGQEPGPTPPPPASTPPTDAAAPGPEPTPV